MIANLEQNKLSNSNLAQRKILKFISDRQDNTTWRTPLIIIQYSIFVPSKKNKGRAHQDILTIPEMKELSSRFC